MTAFRSEVSWSRFLPEFRIRVLQVAALGVPLLVAPGVLGSPVELPKRLLLIGCVLAGLAGLAAETLATGRWRQFRAALWMPAAAFIAWRWLAARGAVNPLYATEASGLLAAQGALAVLAAVTAAGGGAARLTGALLAAAGLEALYGILQYAGIDFMPWASNWGSRCFGTIGNPIFFAEFLEPLFVLSVALWIAERDEERKDLLALLAVVQFLALLFAQTRSAWLGSAAGLAVVFGLLAGPVKGGRDLIRENRTWLLSFGGLALAVAITISSPAVFGTSALPLRDRVRDAFNVKGWTVRHRMVLWRSALVMARSRPLTGLGAEGFHAAFPLVQATFRPAYLRAGFSYPPKEQRAHNDYVQTLAEEGVIGLGLLLWVLVAVGRLGWRAARRASGPAEGALVAGLLGGCAALAVDANFNFPFHIVPAAVVFWLFAGLLAGLGADAGVPAAAPAGLARLGSLPRRTLAVLIGAATASWFGLMAVPAVEADRAAAAGDANSAASMWEMADVYYARSLELRPDDPLVRYEDAFALQKSAIYDWTGHVLDRAMRQYEAARRLGLNDEMVYGQLALLAEQKGNYARAVAEAETSVRIFPEDADHASNLGYWLAMREERLPEALDLERSALSQVPEHPLYLWMAGLVLEKLKRYPESLAAMRAAIPNLVRIQNGAGYRPELDRDIARVARLAARGR